MAGGQLGDDANDIVHRLRVTVVGGECQGEVAQQTNPLVAGASRCNGLASLELPQYQATETSDVLGDRGGVGLTETSSPPESAQHGPAEGVDQDVIRAHCPVVHSPVVQVGERSGNTGSDSQQGIEVEVVEVGEGDAVDPGQSQLDPVAVVADLDRIHHTGMGCIGENACLVTSALRLDPHPDLDMNIIKHNENI